jgi:hypothetical protein
MTEIRRSVKCSNCGRESSIYISADLSLNDLLIQGKCTSCGGSLQLNYSLVDSGSTSSYPSSSSSSAVQEALPTVPIEDNMVEEEFPSDAIRDLMDG